MDLLQTLLVYMSLVFATSVQTAPEPVPTPEVIPTPTPYVTATPSPTPVPGLDITPNPAYKTLQVGDRGELVKAMQEKLMEYGYYDGEVDGAFGNQTRQAVEKFQYYHGLSADGIAGKRTLTVLYEAGEEIRLAPGAAAETPAPVSQLSAAITPEPTEEPVPAATFQAVQTITPTPAPTATPAPTPAPTPIPASVEKMDYSLLVNGEVLEYAPCQQEDTVYLPMLEILKSAGVLVLDSSSIELDEYAYAWNGAFVRITHTENQCGAPENLQAYLNDEPMLVPDRSLLRLEDVLYVPIESVESITGLTFEVYDESRQIVAVLPVQK